MLQLNNYILKELITEISHYQIFRAVRKSDELLVSAKVVSTHKLSRSSLANFENEHQILSKLNSNHVIRLIDFVDEGSKKAIITENFDAKPLNEYLKDGVPALTEFLDLAIEICNALNYIHTEGFIHKNICPENILYRSAVRKIKLINFDHATRYIQKFKYTGDISSISSMLKYVSPEQTGRLNRFVDNRSDLYSFGVVCYEILTGTHPFPSQNNTELIYSHLAKVPQPLTHFSDSIPPVISDIVLKLMSKNPENRYQSAKGVLEDFKRFKTDLISGKSILSFPLGSKDFTGELKLSQQLYNRVDELQQIENCFRNATNNNVLLIIKGEGGAGKSSLIGEIVRSEMFINSLFIEGKCDNLQQNTPYYPIVEALTHFCHIIMSKTAEEFAQWKKQLSDFLGDISQVIMQLVPAMKNILNISGAIPELDGYEAQNRFIYAFKQLFKAITNNHTPIVIFIDDIQWGDANTLDLLSILLVDKSMSNLMVIFTVRPHELAHNPQLIGTIENIKQKNEYVSEIKLHNLDIQNIQMLISESLHHNFSGNIEGLAKTIINKTQGNPFAVKQFLQHLYDTELLKYNFEENTWNWDLQKINNQQITDNVVELMINKMQLLPVESLNILKNAACIGRVFSLEILEVITGFTSNQLAIHLEDSLINGILLPASEVLDSFAQYSLLKFSHDRIRQAAYESVEDSKKAEFHLAISRILYAAKSETEINEEPFTITNQYNLAIDKITDERELQILAKLNFLAARKSKKSIAYKTASVYSNIATNLIRENLWLKDFDLAAKIIIEAAEIEFLSGNYATMQMYIDRLFQKTNDIHYTIRLYELMIISLNAQNEPAKSVEKCIEILASLDIKIISKHLTLFKIYWVLKVWMKAISTGKQKIKRITQENDFKKSAAIRIITIASPAVYASDTKYAEIMMFKMVYLALTGGTNKYTGFAFTILAHLVGNYLHLKKGALKIGETALYIAEKVENNDLLPRTSITFDTFILHWWKPAYEILNKYKKGFVNALENGDVEFAAVAAGEYVNNGYLAGNNLKQLNYDFDFYTNAIHEISQNKQVWLMSIYWQVVQNLLNMSENPTILTGNILNEDKFLHDVTLAFDKNLLGNFYANKLILLYLFNEYEQAFNLFLRYEKSQKGFIGAFLSNTYCLYETLVLIKAYAKLPTSEKIKFGFRIHINIKKLKKWSKFNPSSNKHKYMLAKAEYLIMRGKKKNVHELFDKAAQLAKDSGFMNDEALIYESAALYFNTNDTSNIAQIYMQHAAFCYAEWGAKAKVNQLTQKYSSFIISKPFDTFINSVGGSKEELSEINTDIISIITSSQNLSKEENTNLLIEKMMTLLMEHNGAEKGYLIFNNAKYLTIEAESVQNQVTNILKHTTVNNSDMIPQSIINYVIRTRNTIISNDILHDKKYNTDPYIIKNRLKSVLCYPIKINEKQDGVIYLENNLIFGAFTEKRVKLTMLIANQFSFLLGNTLYIKSIQSKVKTLNEKIDVANQLISKQKQNITHFRAKLNANIFHSNMLLEMLTMSENIIKQVFSDYFIFNRNSATSSRDFYWVKQFKTKNVFCIADGNESGVDGYLFGLAGFSLLADICFTLDAENKLDAGSILNTFSNKFVQILGQTPYENIRRTEIRISVFIFENQNLRLQYSGSLENSFIVSKVMTQAQIDANEIQLVQKYNEYCMYQLKTDSKYYATYFDYKNNELKLSYSDIILLTTNGIFEQIGGTKGEKYPTDRFKKMVLENSKYSFEEQKQLIESEMNTWMGNDFSLVDDILTIALKI